MAEILVGYARCSTTSQDVRAQLSALKQLGVTDEHLHTDRGRTGRNRERPGLTAALGAVRDGDVLVVTKNAATQPAGGPPSTPCTIPLLTLWITSPASAQVRYQMAPHHVVVLSGPPLSKRR